MAVTKTATIVDSRQSLVHIIRPIKFWTIPVVKVAIEPLVPSDLPKLLEALRRANKSFPLMYTKVEESGEHVIMGTGEVEMDSILHDIREMYSDIEVKISDPSVCFC
jgi:U5 small nuclear ribonucleoprotein component